MISIISLLPFCRNKDSGPKESVADPSVIKEISFITEVFVTPHDTAANVDSPAVWHGPDGEHWILSTAKSTHEILVHDALTGVLIRRFGILGSGMGELLRPNGIVVLDNIAMITERDNHRVQVFTLPQCESAGYFGQYNLRRPYGITAEKISDGYTVYITDNYEMPDESIPPAEDLGERVHHFKLEINENGVAEAEHLNAFGDTSGDGILFKVESILIDIELGRLLIADELEEQRNIKIYSLDGEFSGQILPAELFQSEPEGIVLFRCDDDTSGYYIITDQSYENNYFQVFDRQSFAYLGGFSGNVTRNTDGVALTQNGFGNFTHGAFFAVHDDCAVAAFAWSDIAKALSLKMSCE